MSRTKSSGFDVFNYFMYTYGVFSHRKIATKAFNTQAKIGFNSRVAGLRDTYGVAKHDVKPLIFWVFMNTDEPTKYSRIDLVFARYKEYVKWKLDFHYEIKNLGLFQAIRQTRTTKILPDEDAGIIEEIEEAFFL